MSVSGCEELQSGGTHLAQYHKLCLLWNIISSSKEENLEDIDKFLDIFDLPKLNQEDVNILKIYITHRD